MRRGRNTSRSSRKRLGPGRPCRVKRSKAVNGVVLTVAATTTAPQHSHNMLPLEAFALGAGNVEEVVTAMVQSCVD